MQHQQSPGSCTSSHLHAQDRTRPAIESCATQGKRKRVIENPRAHAPTIVNGELTFCSELNCFVFPQFDLEFKLYGSICHATERDFTILQPFECARHARIRNNAQHTNRMSIGEIALCRITN